MRLIVGLGNPGRRYRDTPHNAGFLACDRFADRHHFEPDARRFQGRFRRGRVGALDIGVLKPQTYMNLSGDSVGEAVRYLPLEPEDLIAVWDEMDLPAGRIRIRPRGGDAGHLGVRSMIERLGTGDFPRVRIGVGRPAPGRDATGHLLSRVRMDERERFDRTVDLAVDALDTILERGVDEAMNRYNGLAPIGEEGASEDKEQEGDA